MYIACGIYIFPKTKTGVPGWVHDVSGGRDMRKQIHNTYVSGLAGSEKTLIAGIVTGNIGKSKPNAAVILENAAVFIRDDAWSLSYQCFVFLCVCVCISLYVHTYVCCMCVCVNHII